MENKQLAIVDKAKLMMPDQKKFLSANPFEMNYSQECGFAIMAIQNNPYLLNCSKESMQASIVSVALTGISLNPALKYAYLVPRKVKSELRATLDISYIGMIKILTDAGAVKNVFADVVCERDHFVYGQGSQPVLEHRPDLLKDRGNPIGAYSIAYFRDGGFQFEVMSKPEIEKVRAMSESWKNESTREYSPWERWESEMWKKTVLKRLFKVLPKTEFNEQLIAALGKEHDNEVQDISRDDELKQIFDDIEIQDSEEVSQLSDEEIEKIVNADTPDAKQGEIKMK